MSYQVLARKWRPRSFDAVVGQQHVVRALVNGLDHDRLHHAFLFTGTRGVGKTTLARILARALNCEQGVSSTPCGECSSCREIDEGRFVDLIEVDAASRTKVEDTRELLDNVQYAPTRGRYKVYLIDEVHMLSGHSFNALLKTLEEPPPHVKFLLATTDPQKLPVTILSRCLQFNLKRLSLATIAEHLQWILEQEGIASDPAAVQRLARAADGSLRDGLSLLDQALAFGGGGLRDEETRAMLGSIERDHVIELLEALAQGEAKAVLDAVARLDESAPDYETVLGDVISLLHRVALAQLAPEALDDAFGDRERTEALAQRLTAEDVQLYYQIALNGRRDLPLAPLPRDGFEMVMLRMLAFRPDVQEGAAGPAQRPAPAARPGAAGDGSDASAAAAAGSPPPSPASPAPDSEWGVVVEALGLNGVARELAANCILVRREGRKVVLRLGPSCAGLRSRGAEERLQQALERYYGEGTRLVIEEGAGEGESPAEQRRRQEAERQRAAEASIDGDENVQALRAQFNAEVNPGSVRPVDETTSTNEERES